MGEISGNEIKTDMFSPVLGWGGEQKLLGGGARELSIGGPEVL